MENEILELLQGQDERLRNIESLLSSSKTVLNVDEVEHLTNLKKSTIYKLTSSGAIPHFKKNKHLFFDRVEIENWLKSNRVKTSEQIDREAMTYVKTKRGRA